MHAIITATITMLALTAVDSPETRGRSIAVQADAHDLGWHDNVSEMRMLLTNRHGQESVREMRRHALETREQGLGDRSIVIFDSPRDIDGTAFLSHTKVANPDDQWIYLPALKRVKRISSKNKSGPFVGSEFAYEDLLSQEVDKYTYRWLRDESLNDLATHVVERVPTYKNSGYTKQIVWWDTDHFRVQRIEFYDRKGALLKTLDYEGYRLYLDAYWRPDVMRMQNHLNGKSTVLEVASWNFQTGVKEALFTPGRLKRVR